MLTGVGKPDMVSRCRVAVIVTQEERRSLPLGEIDDVRQYPMVAHVQTSMTADWTSSAPLKPAWW